MTASFPAGRNPFTDETVNPYASPQTASIGPGLEGEASLWRKGRTLIIRRGSKLPHICVKTNAAAETHLPCKLLWHHPAIYLSVFLLPLLYIILALVLRQKANFELPVSQEYANRCQRAKRMAQITLGVGVSLLLCSFLLLQQRGDACVLLLAGAGAIILSLVLFSRNVPLKPIRIDEQFIHVRGAHPDYLDRWPQWPYA